MTINFSVGDYVVVNRAYVGGTLKTLASNQTLQSLGNLGSDPCRVAAVGNIAWPASSYIRVVPLNNQSIAYKNGGGLAIYFSSDDLLNSSFEFSSAFIADSQYLRCLNTSGSLIPKGSVVRQVGFDATQQKATINLSSAADISTAVALGITEEAIDDNAVGTVLVDGSFQTDTTAFSSVGNTAYLSNTPGNITTATGNISVIIGQVLSIATNGTITFFASTTGGAGAASAAPKATYRQITFDAGGDPPYEEGTIYFDNQDKCLTVYNDIPGTALQVGQETVVRAYNNTGNDIDDGSVVYISGASGQRPTIALAQANNSATAYICGVTTHNIAKNTEGLITVRGVVRGIDTRTWGSAGDTLYLSATTAGKMVNVMPNVPNYGVVVAILLVVDINGSILVNPGHALKLDELSDVDGITPTGGELLYFKGGGSNYWEVTSGISIGTTEATFSLIPVLPSYTVTALASITPTVGAFVFVTDESSGAVTAFGDGTNWRRTTDRNVIS